MDQPVKRAFYDFSVSPFSYDFVPFLLCARSNDCTEVVFVPGTRMGIDKDGKPFEYQKCTIEEQERRLANILLPLCAKAIVCNDREAAKELWHEGCFPPGYTVENPRYSHLLANVLTQKTMWPMHAPPSIVEEVRRDVGDNPIIIPMRETPYRQARNSNEAAWIKVAEWLVARGENVWFVPDTAHTDKVYPAGKTYPKAALSIIHRLALANIAKLTIGVNSGNMAFSFYSRSPMLYFNPVVEGSNEASVGFWERNFIRVGSQLPWFTNLQRIIWNKQDDYESIIESLETWYAVRDGKRQWEPALLPRFPLVGVVSNKERSEHVRQAMATGHPRMKRECSFHEQWLSLACFGPSLKKTWLDLKHPIMAVSGAHDFLISKGVIPDYYVACDPREEQCRFLENPHPDVHYLMATCMHPNVWEMLKDSRVTLWHLRNGLDGDAGILEHDPGGELIGGGSTVGLRAMEIAGVMGFKNFDIHGMDSSYDLEGDRHAGNHPGKTQGRVTIQVYKNPRPFISSPQMKEAAEEFMNMMAPRRVIQDGVAGWERLHLGVRFHGDGLLQTWWAETEKYRKERDEAELLDSGLYVIHKGKPVPVASIGEGLSRVLQLNSER